MEKAAGHVQRRCMCMRMRMRSPEALRNVQGLYMCPAQMSGWIKGGSRPLCAQAERHDRLLSLNERIEPTFGATVRSEVYRRPVLFLLERVPGSEYRVRVPVTADAATIWDLVAPQQQQQQGSARKTQEDEFRGRVLERVPGVRGLIDEAMRQSRVYLDVARMLWALRADEAGGAGGTDEDARLFVALHGLLPLSAMAPEAVRAAWAGFHADADADTDAQAQAHTQAWAGLRINVCRGGEFDWTYNWRRQLNPTDVPNPADPPMHPMHPMHPTHPMHPHALEVLNDWIEPMGMSWRHGALCLVRRAFRRDFQRSASSVVTRDPAAALELLGYERPAEVAAALLRFGSGSSSSGSLTKLEVGALLCSSRLFSPGVLQKRRCGKFGGAVAVSPMQAYAAEAYPTAYADEDGRATGAQLEQLRDALSERAFDAFPGAREAFAEAAAQTATYDDVEAAIRDADPVDDFVRRARGRGHGEPDQFDLRSAAIGRWQDFVKLRGLLPLSKAAAADVDAARADWAAFRDELLVPGGLAPHDWVHLKLFSLGREGARPGGASPRRPRAKA